MTFVVVGSVFVQPNAVNPISSKKSTGNQMSNAAIPLPLYFSLNPSFEKPKFMRYLSSKKHIPGNDIILPCTAIGAKPMMYMWELNGKPLVKKHRLKFAFKQSLLKIKRIREEDIGIYTCTVINPYGKLSFDFHVKTADKQKEPIFYDYSLMLRKKSTIRATQQSVRFLCEAASIIPVHYLWLKNGRVIKHIKPTKSAGNRGDIELNSLKVKDGGRYTCIAFNKYGNTSFAYELKILWRLSGGPPKVVPFTRPQLQYANVGDNVTFDCLEIISATLPHVQWFHILNKNNPNMLPQIPESLTEKTFKNSPLIYGKHISPNHYSLFRVNMTSHRSNNKYIYDNANPTGIRLNIESVSVSDTGAYTCFISNTEGKDYAVFYLVVNDSQENSTT